MNKKYYVDDATIVKAVETGYIESLGCYIELLEDVLLTNTDRDIIEDLVGDCAAALSLRDELDVDEYSVLGDTSNGEFELLTADEVMELIKE